MGMEFAAQKNAMDLDSKKAVSAFENDLIAAGMEGQYARMLGNAIQNGDMGKVPPKLFAQVKSAPDLAAVFEKWGLEANIIKAGALPKFA